MQATEHIYCCACGHRSTCHADVSAPSLHSGQDSLPGHTRQPAPHLPTLPPRLFSCLSAIPTITPQWFSRPAYRAARLLPELQAHGLLSLPPPVRTVPSSQVRALAWQLRPRRLKQWSKMPFHPGSLYLIGFPSLSKRAFFLPRSSGLPSVPCRETQVSMLWKTANSSRHSGSMADAADCQHAPYTAFIVDCMHSGSTAAGV